MPSDLDRGKTVTKREVSRARGKTLGRDINELGSANRRANAEKETFDQAIRIDQLQAEDSIGYQPAWSTCFRSRR
jgi:hypothetical protein